MKWMHVFSDWAFIGPNYLLQAEHEWCRTYFLHSHMSLISEIGQLNDGIAFAYDQSFSIEAKGDNNSVEDKN